MDGVGDEYDGPEYRGGGGALDRSRSARAISLAPAPATPLAKEMLTADKFVQREPKDGATCSQRTQAYMGYHDKSFYVVFLAFDTEPKLLRARMLRR